MKDKTKTIIVIPCLAENGIWETLESLRNNSGYTGLTECFIVINHSEKESLEKKIINHNLSDQLKSRLAELDSGQLRFKVIDGVDLPAKKAGVGLARKLGMDKAIQKFKDEKSMDEGVIVCLDGDCMVAENYLSEIEKFFARTRATGCSIYFEHPLESENREAIIEYELYLRYYANALRWCGFPFAFQTVGSSMAVSARAYEKQGGMNTRQAGEDFYFLNKIIQLGNFGDLASTTVYPSARKSERVPFGTGREMMEWEESRQIMSYPPEIFAGLKKVLQCIDQLRNAPDPSLELNKSGVDPSIITYLNNQKFNEAVFEVRAHTATLPAFRKRFFVWMNAFRVMKLLNELSHGKFKKNPIHISAGRLWGQLTNNAKVIRDSRELLLNFRSFDRSNPKFLGLK